MSPIAQSMRVSATIGKKWLQKVAVGVLDHMEQLVICIFNHLGSRRLNRTAVTSTHTPS